MIHEIGRELDAALIAVNCPIRVIDGPENTETTTYARERIVIEHSPDGDDFAAPKSQHKNPKQLMLRNIGVTLTIYAQSPGLGAAYWEHVRRAEHILDLVLVALYDVIKKRKNAWTAIKGKLISPADLQASEAPGGAVYQLVFSVERSVNVQTWAGDPRPSAAVNTINSTTNVGIAGDMTTETGCGT